MCEAVGWGDLMNFAAAEHAVPRSLHAVVAVAHGHAIGMGRVVGDGGIFFYVQDVAVVPAWQRRGVGTAMLSQLVRWVEENAPDKAFVGVFAVKGTEGFYERFGFSVHSSDVGMFQVIRRSRPRSG